MNSYRVGPDPEDRIPTSPCHLHEEPNPWCVVCRGDRSPKTMLRYRAFSDEEKADLRRVSRQYANHPEDRLPVFSWDEVLEAVIRECRGDVS